MSEFSEEGKSHKFNKEVYYFSFTMGKRRVLSPYEICKIAELIVEGKKVKDLAIQFGVSVRTIYRVTQPRRGKKRTKGRLRALTPHQRQKILAEARKNPTKSAKALAYSVGVSCSSRTVQRVLVENSFVHIRKRKTDQLSENAKEKRLHFARAFLPNDLAFWHKVVFSDEKKWNLKGNDGYVSIWVEQDKKYTFETDCRRRPGIMVWGAISANGARYICRMKGAITSKAYVEMLEKVLLEDVKEDLPVDWIFQQDNAPAHNAHATRQYLEEEGIRVLEWPPYSPDLNIIENVWGMVSNEVYKEGREYQSADELWESVSEAFLRIPCSSIWRLYESIPERLIAVLEQGGRRTRF